MPGTNSLLFGIVIIYVAVSNLLVVTINTVTSMPCYDAHQITSTRYEFGKI